MFFGAKRMECARLAGAGGGRKVFLVAKERRQAVASRAHSKRFALSVAARSAFAQGFTKMTQMGTLRAALFIAHCLDRVEARCAEGGDHAGDHADDA